MPKNSGKRRKPFTWVRVNAQISLGTLIDDTVLKGSISTLTEDFYFHNMLGTWSIAGLALAEVPIMVGFAHDDYSVTEIEETLDSGATFTSPDDKIAQEQSRRLVRTVGTFSAIGVSQVLNNGEQVRTGMKFVIGDGHGLAMWALNQTGGTLTTGATVRFIGHAVGRWIR